MSDVEQGIPEVDILGELVWQAAVMSAGGVAVPQEDVVQPGRHSLAHSGSVHQVPGGGFTARTAQAVEVWEGGVGGRSGGRGGGRGVNGWVGVLRDCGN